MNLLNNVKRLMLNLLFINTFFYIIYQINNNLFNINLYYTNIIYNTDKIINNITSKKNRI